MASVRFVDVQSRPTEFLDVTSLTLDEFQQLVVWSKNSNALFSQCLRANHRPLLALQSTAL